MADLIQSTLDTLKASDGELKKFYPGDPITRQPVHTVYGGAHLFKSDTPKKMGDIALQTFREYVRHPRDLNQNFNLNLADVVDKVYTRIIDKLKTEPVEDFRIDFEDGYGIRPDREEDEHAVQAAKEMAKGAAEKTLCPFIGMRIKPFTPESFPRSQRTLDLFVTTLLKEINRGPAQGDFTENFPNFIVTLPKVTSEIQIASLTSLLKDLENKHHLPTGSIKLEFMVETTQSILDTDGRNPLMRYVRAAEGRCLGAHFGTYDYTAACNITATYQTMAHPACEFAKSMMQVALAGSGVFISDGATNIMPIPPHKISGTGEPLSAQQINENRASVYRAWKISYSHIRHSLECGFYQGWDLHPNQLPMRYFTTYLFFLENLSTAADRLHAFMSKAARATLLGDVFDDAATGQGLLNYFIRALNCGAITEDDTRATGLTMDEIRTRSFLKILAARKGG